MDIDRIEDSLGSLSSGFGRGLKRVFGNRNDREVARMGPRVNAIGAREEWAHGMDQAAMQAQLAEWKASVDAGDSTVDDLLIDCFAMVREAAHRSVAMRPFDVQLVGGMVLHNGAIAEMATGEGKTLVATLPCVLNALSGRSVFIVTVNDYLARRDRDWMAPVFEYLGLTVGAIQSDMGSVERKEEYACDITYGTNNEFGFDYLRDNMKVDSESQVQKDLAFAIVDEVDSILIDEARTPLIISGPSDEATGKYQVCDRIARQLKKGEHYEVKEKEHSCTLTEEGIERAQSLAGVPTFYSGEHMDWPHHIEQALRAHGLYRLDKDYIVKDGEIIIVDEFTGRLMQGRRWSDGLHQAVEAKEGIKPRAENQTLATITFQNYFRLFDKLAGMTGTALTEAGEFSKIYDLDVVAIPTNKPCVREDAHDLVYRTQKEKWKALADEIEEVYKSPADNGVSQPMLVGTTSIEKSELISGMLDRRGIPHEVLNAKQHEREADIVEEAGQPGRVTVATNMAGRGTDIVLGEGVIEAGGLYVIGTERHEARRIDNQLRGRGGRQGDPGGSRFYLSMEDDLMRIFYPEWMVRNMDKLGLKEGEEIESGMVTRAIAKAQKKVEQRNFDIRKNLLEYDEVLDTQRKLVYSIRQDLLEDRNLRENLMNMVFEVAEDGVAASTDEDGKVDRGALRTWAHRQFHPEVLGDLDLNDVEGDDLADSLTECFETAYEAREERLGADAQRRLERYLMLNAIDSRWKEHLADMDALKAGIGLRGWAQIDPKIEYKKEGFEKFEALQHEIAREVTEYALKVRIRTQDEERLADTWAGAEGSHPEAAGAAAIGPPPAPVSAGPDRYAGDRAAQEAAIARDQSGGRRVAPLQTAAQVGRNEPCPCGSGKKYKKCCGG